MSRVSTHARTNINWQVALIFRLGARLLQSQTPLKCFRNADQRVTYRNNSEDSVLSSPLPPWSHCVSSPSDYSVDASKAMLSSLSVPGGGSPEMVGEDKLPNRYDDLAGKTAGEVLDALGRDGIAPGLSRPESCTTVGEDDVLCPLPVLTSIVSPLHSSNHHHMSDSASCVSDSEFVKYDTSHRFFDEQLANEEGFTNGRTIAKFLKESGLLPDDPRLPGVFAALLSDHHEYKSRITHEEFVTMVIESENINLLQKAFRHELAVPDFPDLTKRLTEIFHEVGREVPATEGTVAQYIPCLAKVDPNLYGLSICTVDGQRFSIGNASIRFCVQSACKPFNYGLALEEHGEDKVHHHIGREPSGVAFNSLCMNSNNLPHNPLINSGAIMACSLIKTKLPLYERFEYIIERFNEMSGGFQWGFSNPVYLSEKATADQNQCLAYMMHTRFPEGADVDSTLDLYFQSCSLESDCNTLAIAGATLANSGICPLNTKRVFQPHTCRNMLSLMLSCGLYDYSGEWAFSIGLPAKSGVSGCIFAVIPGFGSICTYAPPLDNKGNSVRGIEFFKRIEHVFELHNFSMSESGKINPRFERSINLREHKVAALYAAAEGDLSELRRMLVLGVSPNVADYDGTFHPRASVAYVKLASKGRTLLHLAASDNHYGIVKFLVTRHKANARAVDRWGGTPYSDAEKHTDGRIRRLFDERHL